MTTKLLISLTIALTSLLGTRAFATAEDLQTRIYQAQRECPKLNCPQQKVYISHLPPELKELTQEIRAQMKALAKDLAHAQWPETVLHGKYVNSERFRIEEIQKLVVDSEHVGYRVTYSDKAWDVESCQYDPRNASSLQSCRSGRIKESAFIDLELQVIFRDEEARAGFTVDAGVTAPTR